MIVYLLTNRANGKRYVGKSKLTLDERLYHHRRKARTKVNTYLYRAMRKYGVDEFDAIVLEEVEGDGALLNDRERHWIASLRPEYNMTAGGDGGVTSAAPSFPDRSGANNPMYGKRGPDHPAYGLKPSPEQARNQREGVQKAWDNNDARKKAISDQLKAFWSGKRRINGVKVVFNNVEYCSIAEASRKTGYSQSHIRRNGKR